MIPCDIQENTLKADDSQNLSPFCLHLDEKASLSTKTYSSRALIPEVPAEWETWRMKTEITCSSCRGKKQLSQTRNQYLLVASDLLRKRTFKFH